MPARFTGPRLTYNGRRVESVGELARRIRRSDQVASGWSIREIADTLAMLTSVETFEQLTSNRARTHQAAGDILVRMAGALFVERPRDDR